MALVGRPPKLTPAEARYVRRVRKLRDRVPSSRELAQRFGTTINVITKYERGEIKHYRESTDERTR